MTLLVAGVLGLIAFSVMPAQATDPPTIAHIKPDRAPVGTPIVIRGSGFSAAATNGAVSFGGVPSSVYEIVSDTRIKARIPPEAPNGRVKVTTASGVASSPVALTVTTRHVVIIEFENKALSEIVGSSAAPYINRCLVNEELGACPDPSTAFPTANFTQMYAAERGSLYDYLDLTSGNTPLHEGLPCGFSPTKCPDADVNIVDQLEAAGLTWGSYAQDYPGPEGTCNLKNGLRQVGTNVSAYGAGHVPWLFYTDLRTDPARCARMFGTRSGSTKAGAPLGGDAGLTTLTAHLNAGTLPNFSFISPNQFTIMHTVCSSGPCPPGAPAKIPMGDRFLAYWIPHLMAGMGADDRIVVTWDEGKTRDLSGCCMAPGGPTIKGGHIPTFVIGGSVVHGPIATPVTVFSLLTAVEDLFSLPGNIPSPTPTQVHQLNQPYGTCDCTPRMPL
jgi:hypothetical protein